MRRLLHGVLTLLVTSAAWCAVPPDSLAFKYVAVGDPLPRLRLAPVAGGPAVDYLGGEDDTVRVFAFVGEGSDRSLALLPVVRDLHARFAGRGVHWCLIVTDRDTAAWADSVAAACPGVPVLVDRGDVLYGTLGVPLTPVVGMGDRDRVLRAYLPYHKVNYGAIIAAHVQHLLGDLDDAGLARVLAPRRQRVRDTADAAVSRSLKLARLLLERGKPDKALGLARRTVNRHPAVPAAHRLLADVLAALGDSAAAATARARADSLAATVPADTGTAGSGVVPAPPPATADSAAAR